MLAAKAEQNEAKAVREQRMSERDYRKKEYVRIKELVRKGDVEERLADEEHDHYLSAEGAVHSAEAGIETAAAKFAEATAEVEKAKADLKAAEAGVKVERGQPRYGQGLRTVHQDSLAVRRRGDLSRRIRSPRHIHSLGGRGDQHPATHRRQRRQDAHNRAGARPRRRLLQGR